MAKDYKDVIDYYKSLKLSTKEDYENFLENFSVLFAYNSGRIENEIITYHDTREIFTNGKVVGYSGDLKHFMK